MAAPDGHLEGRPETDRRASPTEGERQRVLWTGWSAAVVLALLATVITCRCSPQFSSLEFSLLDRWLSLRPARQSDPRIVLVGIEKGEIDWHRKHTPKDCVCATIPRSRLGRAISRVKRGGAKVVVLDLLLQQACLYGRDTPRAHDQRLVQALDEPGETILVAGATPAPDKLYFTDPAKRFVGESSQHRIVASPVLYNPHGVVRGVSLIQTAAPTNLEKTEARPLDLVGRTMSPLGVAAYAVYVGRPSDLSEPSGRHRVKCSGVNIPVWDGACIYLFDPIMPKPPLSKHVMLINWAGPAGTFPMYSLSLSGVLGASDEVLRQWFEDKVVLIGSAADREYTPMRATARQAQPPYVDQSDERTLSGPEVHANVLDTIMQRRFIRPIATPAVWAIIFGCSLLSAFAFRRLATWSAVLITLLEIAVLLNLAMFLVRWDCWFYVALPTAATLFSGIGSALWGYAWSRREAAALADEVQARDAATVTIVHDLKQPLAAIASLAATIRARQQVGEGQTASPELIQRIQQQVERALVDIDELLATSPDSEIPIRCHSFNIAALAQDLAVAQSTKSPLHEIEVRAPEDGVWLTGDARYLGRAISNLVDNAIKYWPEGGTVVVEVEPRPGEAVVRVTDRGLGMSPEQQARIFRRFQRAVPEGMDIAGTGIGLYSVKRIADAHGGTIDAESEPGVGSTFMLTLPVEPVVAEP